MRLACLGVGLAALAGCAAPRTPLPSVEEAQLAQSPQEFGRTWTYMISGDPRVRPLAISDDGIRTRILYSSNQALPAVFAIGPTGEELAVNGYMRGDTFVIDRVYAQLMFRIDKARATARRSNRPNASDTELAS